MRVLHFVHHIGIGQVSEHLCGPPPVVSGDHPVAGGGDGHAALPQRPARPIGGHPGRSVGQETDPVAPLDLPAWCHLTGRTYLGPVPGAGRPAYAVQVRANGVPTDPAHP
jgi:hypothetical protein